MKKYSVVLLVVMMLVSVLSLTSVQAEKRLQIAMIPKSLDNPVFLDAKVGGEKAAKALGVDFIWTGSNTADAANEVTVIEGLIQKKVDGIIISCNDADALKDVINRAVAAGIKVACFDSDSKDSKRAFYCGTDNLNAGKACGKAMVKLVKDRKMAGKTLTCAILTGGLGAPNLNDRIKGFKEVVATNKIKLKYVTTLACDDDTNKGVELMEQYIKANPKLDTFFVVGGWPYFSAPGSMPNIKAWIAKGGVLVSMDTFYPVLKAMKDGLASALVGQDFTAMGDQSVRSMVDLIKGKKVPEFVGTGIINVDKSNFDKVFAETKPW
jgi:ribose transport system substrate-binding protein